MNSLCSPPMSSLLLTVSLSLIAAIESRANAPILDQQNVATSKSASLAVYGGQHVAQTFTAGRSGYLHSIELQISRSAGITGSPPVFRILPTSIDGSPAAQLGDALYSQALELNSIPVISTAPSPLTTVDVSSAGIWVNAGDKLALMLERAGSGSPPWLVWNLISQGYGSGQLYTQHSPGVWVVPSFIATNPADAGFRTFIAVPEPSTIAIVALLLLAMGRRPRR